MVETLPTRTPTEPAHRKPLVRPTNDAIIAALRESRGMVAVASRRLGMTREALSARIARTPLLQAVRDEEREFTTDTAELALYRSITEREPWAVQFYLRTQGRKRGYGEGLDLTTGGQPLSKAYVGVDLEQV